LEKISLLDAKPLNRFWLGDRAHAEESLLRSSW
jgi:hypothetical protein